MPKATVKMCLSRGIGGPWVGGLTEPLWYFMAAKHIAHNRGRAQVANRRPVGTGRRSPGGFALFRADQSHKPFPITALVQDAATV